MSKNKYKFKNRMEKVAHFIDLPCEAVAGSVGVHIVQDTYCTVENFINIPVLTQDTVVITCREFVLSITGEGINAQELSQGMVVLRGKINGINYKRK